MQMREVRQKYSDDGRPCGAVREKTRGEKAGNADGARPCGAVQDKMRVKKTETRATMLAPTGQCRTGK